jgi:peroxiredoxin Q/BCP
MKTLSVGDYIPEFKLVDQHNKTFTVTEHRGKKLVIYFYPKDESGICTREACAFRDSFADFQSLGATVVGINAAGPSSHLQFAEKNKLPFQLLTDPDNKVLKSFGIRNVLFLTGRETFIVDEHGMIIHSYRAFLDGKSHPDKVLEFLRSAPSAN